MQPLIAYELYNPHSKETITSFTNKYLLLLPLTSFTNKKECNNA